MVRWPTTRRGRFLARLALYGTAVFVGLPLAFSQALVHPLRQPVGPPPPGFEEERIVADGLRLRAWTRPGRADRAAVVIAHGVGDSLESFTQYASVLGRRGHTVLLLDLRGHGGSEGRHTTLGALERVDVRAAVAHLRARGRAEGGLVLMGFSMGTSAVLRAAAQEPDVRAVVLEAPFDTYRGTVAHHAWLFYRIPRWTPLVPLTIAVAEWRAGFDADDVDLVASARETAAPLMVIVDGADPRMPEAVGRRVYDAHRGPKRFWVAPRAEHVGAVLHPDYWAQVLGFLQDQGL
jgi:pimeloyl-ACP methyl ester carboxylesterase